MRSLLGLTLTFLPVACGQISITSPASLPKATVGSPYSFQFTAAPNSLGPFTWGFFQPSAVNPPGTTSQGSLQTVVIPGLSFNGGAGTLSGIPSQPGVYPILAVATGAQQVTATQNATLIVQDAGFAILTATLPLGSVGHPYRQQILVSKGALPYTFSLIGGPSGLILTNDPVTATVGILSGTPTQPGDFTLSLTVTDANNSTASRDIPLKIYSQPVIGSLAVLPPAIVGAAYQATLAAVGGLAPYRYFLLSGNLPQGLTMGQDGVIQGLPAALETATFTVQVIDSLNNSATKQLQLSVVAVPSVKASVPNLSFSAEASGPAPASQQIAVSSSGPDVALDVTTSIGGTLSTFSWLSASPVSGTTPTTIAVSVNQSALPPGSYSGTVTITPRLSVIAPLTIPVSFKVTNKAALTVNPVALSFQVQSGGTVPLPQTFLVTSGLNGTPVPVAATVSSPTSWLSVSGPTSGMTAALFGIAVNPSGLGAGSYNGSILLTSGSLPPLIVPVILTVTADPVVQSGPPQVHFSIDPVTLTTATRATQTVYLNSSGAPLSFSANTNMNWLTVTPTSGTLSSASSTPLTVTVDFSVFADQAALSKYVAASCPSGCNGEITVTASGLTSSPGQPAARPRFGEAAGSTLIINVSVSPQLDALCSWDVPKAGSTLEFKARYGDPADPPSQKLVASTCSTPIPVSAMALYETPTKDGMPQIMWLNVNTAPGSLATTVSVTPQGLDPGYYLGGVNTDYGGVYVHLQVTLTGTDAAAPVVTSITTAGGFPDIAQNTFIEIKGSNLAAASVGTGITWSDAPELKLGKMPSALNGVSVTVNDRPAFVYFISPGQLNVLTPLDSSTGSVQIVVTNNGLTSAPFTATLRDAAPSFLLVGSTKYILATHQDGSLLGPALISIQDFAFTPAKPGEIVTFWAVGFGLPSTQLVNGSSTQSGTLPAYPVIMIGGIPATVTYAGVISPGLYQLNVTIPNLAPDGDNAISASYAGFTTPEGDLITVKR